jgi:hypothetical protein
MGITNIHYLIDPEPRNPMQEMLRAQALYERLIIEHRQGKHPWGSMRRDCPLCQAGK